MVDTNINNMLGDKRFVFMITLLKIFFLYFPAAFAYYTIILAALVIAGVKEDPTAFNPDDYKPIAQNTLQDGTQVTIHAPK